MKSGRRPDAGECLFGISPFCVAIAGLNLLCIMGGLIMILPLKSSVELEIRIDGTKDLSIPFFF